MEPRKEIDRDILKYNIEIAPPWQKSLGSRVARVVETVGKLCTELDEWKWYGSFETANHNPRCESLEQIDYFLSAIKTNEVLNLFIEPESLILSRDEVVSYRHRLRGYYETLDGLHIDSLKHEILQLICLPRAISEHGGLTSFPNGWFDEVSASIIVKFIQELPRLSELRSGLSKWSTRLSVLYEASVFVAKHNKSAITLDSALQASETTSCQYSDDDMTFSDSRLLYHQVTQHLAEAARCLDSMLDLLACSDEMLPSAWLGKFEAIEELHLQSHHHVYPFVLQNEAEPRQVEGVGIPAEMKASKSVDSFDPVIATITKTMNARKIQEQGMGVGEFEKTILKQLKLKSGTRTFKNRGYVLGSARLMENFAYIHGSDTTMTTSLNPTAGPMPVRNNERIKMSADSTANIEDASDMKICTNMSPRIPLRRFINGKLPIPSLAYAEIISENAIQYEKDVNIQNYSSSFERYNRGFPLSRVPTQSLNALHRKRRNHNITPTDTGLKLTPEDKENVNIYDTSPTEDRISKHISDIINTLPSEIQLQSSLAGNPDWRTHKQKQRFHSSSARLITSHRKCITIEPAKSSVKFDQSEHIMSSQGIKLYHLSKTGQEKPVKLFVRLVGDHGERVMVRVGGGWADLRAYLRQYAGIHNSRAVSESNFEIHNTSALRTQSSAPESSPPISSTSPAMPSLTSRICPLETIRAQNRSISSKAEMTYFSGSNGISASSSIQVSGKKSTSSSNVSTFLGQPSAFTCASPSLALSDIVAPLAEPSLGNEFGHGGPMSKKRELSGENNRWAENMIGKARGVSASDTGILEFGDLGRIGKTHRVWLRRRVDEGKA